MRRWENGVLRPVRGVEGRRVLAKGRNLWQRPDRQRRGATRRLGYQEGRREGRGESCPRRLTCASGRRRAPWPCARARGYSVACPVGRSSGRACAWPVCVAGQGRCRVCAAFCPCARARPKTPQSAALLAPGAPLTVLVHMPLPRTCTQGALESKVKKATGTRTQPRGTRAVARQHLAQLPRVLRRRHFAIYL